MTDRFVQQHARPARAEHHRKHPRRGRYRIQVDQRHAYRFTRPGFGTHFTIFIGKEELIAETAAAAAGATLAFAVIIDLHADRQAHQRAHVRCQRTVGSRHQHQFIDAGKAGGDFLHALIGSTRRIIDAVQQLNFLFTRQALQRVERRVERAVGHRTEGA